VEEQGFRGETWSRTCCAVRLRRRRTRRLRLGRSPPHLLGAFTELAEFERDLIRERTNAGLAAARARGRLGGRPRKLAEPKTLALARQLYDAGTEAATICQTLGISRATLYRSIPGRRQPPHTARSFLRNWSAIFNEPIHGW
jgi:DNA invertase Pin-like site-specific DNA recombinase